MLFDFQFLQLVGLTVAFWILGVDMLVAGRDHTLQLRLASATNAGGDAIELGPVTVRVACMLQR